MVSVHATHLGHELHQMCNMEYDTHVKRAQTERILEELYIFAHLGDKQGGRSSKILGLHYKNWLKPGLISGPQI